MKTSPRDRMIMVVLPAIFTLIVYSWGYARKNSEMLREAREQLSTLSSQPPSFASLSQKSNELNRLEDQIADYTKRKAAAQAAAGFKNDVALRAASLKTLTGLADSCELVLIQSVNLKEESASSVKEISDMSKAIDLPSPQLWRLELSGSYLNMLKMLSQLQKTDVFAVPVEVKMEPLKDETEKPAVKWTLTVWI